MSRWPFLFLPVFLAVFVACNDASPEMEGSGAPIITIGLQFACALEDDRTPFCWNLAKEIDFTQISPYMSSLDEELLVSAPEGESFVSLSSGNSHACGLRKDGTPVCWMPISEAEFSPLQLPPEGERFRSIDSRGCYTCGLRPDGTPL